MTTPLQTTPAPRSLGRPVLTTLDAVAQSLAIGPVFSVAFVSVLIAGAVGNSAPLATLLGTMGMLAVSWVIVLYARRYSGAGAIYDYVRHATNPAMGLFSAGIYFIGTLFLGGAGIYLIIGLIGSTVLSTWGIATPWWIIALLAALLVLTMNHFGIQVTTRGQLTLAVLSVLPLLVLAAVIIIQGGNAGNTSTPFNPTSVAPAALFRGIFFAITLFIGFETAASLGEETADPRRAIPRALISTVLIGGGFYLLMIYVSAIGFGMTNAQAWSLDPAPLGTLATRYVGSWLASLIDIAILIDMLAVASAFMATSARGWFALARSGLLPAPFARTSRFDTPIGGNLLVFASALLASGVTAWNHLDPLTGTIILTTAGSLLIEVIYVALAIIAVRFLREEPGRPWRWFVLLIAILTPALAVYGSVVPFPAWPANLGIYSGIGGLVLTTVWTLAIQFIHPRRLTIAAQQRLQATEVGLIKNVGI